MILQNCTEYILYACNNYLRHYLNFEALSVTDKLMASRKCSDDIDNFNERNNLTANAEY
jgi:hypothetical protein